jgi:hypothetical protein
VLAERSTSGVLGVESLANWTGYYYLSAADSNTNAQFAWPYTMVGHSPYSQGHEDDWQGETTQLGAPIVPVTIDLLDTDGSLRFIDGHPLVSGAGQYVAPVLGSPLFSNSSYDSSRAPTQFTDAIARAEFFHEVSSEWHTLLRPRVAPARTLAIPRGSYRFGLNPDGTCCKFVLVEVNAFANALFPPVPTDTTTPIGAAENAGDIRTKDISVFLFNNVFAYSGDLNNCCIIGFHTYDVEPGSAANHWREKRYVLSFVSWVSSGLFKDPTLGDVSVLSHELAETFNDPFGTNTTPWWLSPNGNCQNNLEVGDVIEGLPGAQSTIALNGFAYHVQNEALLQWFARVSPSTAIHGAYSYPDTTILTAASTPQPPSCQPPPAPPTPASRIVIR